MPSRIYLLAFLLALPTAAHASGVQLTPDHKRTLVNKDLSGERWAITCEDDGTITGNVYRSTGEPAFVWCDPQGDDGNPDPYAREYELSCYGSDGCPTQPCTPDQWSLIGNVTLAGSFCLPPEASPEPTIAPTPRPTRTPAPTAVPTPRPTQRPTPSPRPTVRPTPRPTSDPRPACCKVCRTGKACGDGCISRSDSCHKGPGCACNG